MPQPRCPGGALQAELLGWRGLGTREPPPPQKKVWDKVAASLQLCLGRMGSGPDTSTRPGQCQCPQKRLTQSPLGAQDLQGLPACQLCLWPHFLAECPFPRPPRLPHLQRLHPPKAFDPIGKVSGYDSAQSLLRAVGCLAMACFFFFFFEMIWRGSWKVLCRPWG